MRADRSLESIRGDFPALARTVNDKPWVYFDNAATAQKPQRVIDAIHRFYSRDCSSVHRGAHTVSSEVTDLHERARETVGEFLGADSPEEILFTAGTTDSINLVARTFGDARVGKSDEILISAMEHHSNIVPWHLLCERVGARVEVLPFNDRAELKTEALAALITERTKLVAVTHVSNAFGTINPVREIVRTAHAKGVPVLVDGAQAVPHERVNVRDLGCDFYAFSSHKLFGPTGIGVLYANKKVLEDMPPFRGGGGMIDEVTFEKTTYHDLPHRFEAGTPHIAGVIGLGSAIEYVEEIGFETIRGQEEHLLAAATERLNEIPNVRIVGTADKKASVLSFVVDGIHPSDISQILDMDGIAVRAGHHCVQPGLRAIGTPSTVRASLAFYNTLEEIDAFASSLKRAIDICGA